MARVPDPAAVAPSWRFLDTWRVEQPGARASWARAELWIAAAADSAARAEHDLAGHVRSWNRWLEPLGEVSKRDWTEFRPLRLEREEAWSDWLAHLFAESSTGSFARELLGDHLAVTGPSGGSAPQVQREVLTEGNERRADLLLEWPGAMAHIEVKAGDHSFEKTCETGRLLRALHGRGRPWADFILLPPGDVQAWRTACSGPEFGNIVVLTWLDVAVALRRAMVRGAESLHWNTWAHAFCGAVEQKLLGCRPATAGDACSDLERLAAALTQLHVMIKAEE